MRRTGLKTCPYGFWVLNEGGYVDEIPAECKVWGMTVVI